EKNFLPSENLLAGLPDNISNEFISAITLSEGAQMIVAFRIPHLERENKNIIIWTPQEEGGQITWHCKGGAMPDKYRVPECRSGGNSTTNNTSLRTYSSDKSISLLTPASWKSDSGLNVDADIGVSNMRENVFVVVLRESKADFDASVTLSRYADIMANQGLESSAKDIHINEPARDLTVNGLPAQQLAMTGTVDNIKITYVITAIDSGSHFQVIYAWTLASRFDMQRALLKKVSESFTVHAGVNQ
ncbi:MAG: pilin, partial [Pseudomonadota bacterium]|nr:pilin [Pseudomonadota bacterium]